MFYGCVSSSYLKVIFLLNDVIKNENNNLITEVCLIGFLLVNYRMYVTTNSIKLSILFDNS